MLWRLAAAALLAAAASGPARAGRFGGAGPGAGSEAAGARPLSALCREATYVQHWLPLAERELTKVRAAMKSEKMVYLIGQGKSGTTSLADWLDLVGLASRGDVKGRITKEAHMFTSLRLATSRFPGGGKPYAAGYKAKRGLPCVPPSRPPGVLDRPPRAATTARRPKRPGLRLCSGVLRYGMDATPTAQYPEYAPRLARAVPHAKLILLLREPAARAFSHYRMVEYRLKHHCSQLTVDARNVASCEARRQRRTFAASVRWEMESFKAAQCAPGDPERRDFHECFQCQFNCRSKYTERGDVKECLMVENRVEAERRHPVRAGYVQAGLYGSIVQHWLRFFPREQLLVLTTTHMDDKEGTLARVARFLGLPLPAPKSVPDIPHANTRQPTPEQTASYHEVLPELREFFRPEMELLAELTGVRFPEYAYEERS